MHNPIHIPTQHRKDNEWTQWRQTYLSHTSASNRNHLHGYKKAMIISSAANRRIHQEINFDLQSVVVICRERENASNYVGDCFVRMTECDQTQLQNDCRRSAAATSLCTRMQPCGEWQIVSKYQQMPEEEAVQSELFVHGTVRKISDK